MGLYLGGILLFAAIISKTMSAWICQPNSSDTTVYNLMDFPNTEESESKVCLSSSCIHRASEMIRGLDGSQNPCEDFYEYACGGWIRNNPLPEGKSKLSIFTKIENENQLVVRNYLEKVNATDGAEAKARIYYEACLDEDEIKEKLGGKPLLSFIKNLGGWHLLPSTTVPEYKWDLLTLLSANKYDWGSIFYWNIVEDIKESSLRVIEVIDDEDKYLMGDVVLTLGSRDYYLNITAHKNLLDAYLDYMTRICVLLGANETEARIQMSRVIQLETELANITKPIEQKRDIQKLYNTYTIRQWQKEAPFLNWTLFFNNAFKLVNRSISETERIVVTVPDYFKNLNRIISKYCNTEEGKRTVTSYIMWRASNSLSPLLSKSFSDAIRKWNKAFSGAEMIEETWRECVSETDSALGFALGAMFVRKAFHGEARKQSKVMIDNIRSAFKKNLKNLNWIDAETRHEAELKADAIDELIGYPDYILKKEELDKHYEKLEVKPNEYFANFIALNEFQLSETLQKLFEPVNRNEWDMTPSTVNAEYNDNLNEISFPAGVLQMPFYHVDNPNCVNYGSIGTCMGHELTHAFDDNGMHFDRFGNVRQWWDNATIARFKQRADCIQKQYSDYNIEGHHLNGLNTLGENIADNGGLKSSYHAYLDYSRGARVNLTLPGLKYNHQQIFFISFAQTFCSAQTKENIVHQIKVDVHSPGKFRVIGALSNLKEFSEQFGCPVGSKMNPESKCEVW